MKVFIIIFSFLLSACHSANSSRNADEDIKPSVHEDFNQLIPHELKSYISETMPGWTIPDTSDYIKSWWSFYDKDINPYATKTDINDDGLADYGLLLKNNNRLCLVILTGHQNSFTHWIATNFDESFNSESNKIHFGLLVQQPGQIDIALPEIKSLVLKSNAINLMDFETRVCVFYWDNAKMEIFKTSKNEN